MKYSYSFNSTTILYNTAYEFGVKIYDNNLLYLLGGNPYDPDNTDYDKFNDGYRWARGFHLEHTCK